MTSSRQIPLCSPCYNADLVMSNICLDVWEFVQLSASKCRGVVRNSWWLWLLYVDSALTVPVLFEKNQNQMLSWNLRSINWLRWWGALIFRVKLGTDVSIDEPGTLQCYSNSKREALQNIHPNTLTGQYWTTECLPVILSASLVFTIGCIMHEHLESILITIQQK